MATKNEKMLYELKYDDYKAFCSTTLRELRSKLHSLGLITEDTDFSMMTVRNIQLLLRFVRYLK